jgi:trimethylamine:corrinoid methyltransferase-like protein
MEQIIDASFNLLASVGLKATGGGILDRLKKLGYYEKDSRILIPKKRSREFLEELRKNKELLLADIERNTRDRLVGALSGYTMDCKDYRSGRVEPFTVETLEEHAKLVQKIRKRYPALLSTAPGYPSDVPPEMESVAKYRTSVKYCDGEWLFEPTSLAAANYLFEMADVVGHKVDRLPVYPVTPLVYSGDSIDIVLANKDRLKSAYVFSMPSLGVTAPLSVSMSFAVVLAEVLGSGLLTHELTGLDILIRPEIFPYDMRSMNYAYGSPEKFVYEAMSADFLAQLLDVPVNYHCTNIHSMSMLEKVYMDRYSLMTAGALFGATKFYCVGTLGFDQIFSPVQLILDLEMIRQLQRMIDLGGIEEIPVDFADMIGKNIDGNFIATDLTRRNYKNYLEYSQVFRKTTIEEAEDGKAETDRVIAFLDGLQSEEAPEMLSLEQEKEIDRIYAMALGYK